MDHLEEFKSTVKGLLHGTLGNNKNSTPIRTYGDLITELEKFYSALVSHKIRFDQCHDGIMDTIVDLCINYKFSLSSARHYVSKLYRIPKPTKVIFLNVSPIICFARKKDLYYDIEYLKKRWQIYLKLISIYSINDSVGKNEKYLVWKELM